MQDTSKVQRGVPWRANVHLVAGVFAALMLGCGSGSSDEFSATQTTTRGGRTPSSSKIFLAPQKM